MSHDSENQHRDDRFDDEDKQNETNNLRNIMQCGSKIHMRPQENEKYYDKEISKWFDSTRDFKSIGWSG